MSENISRRSALGMMGGMGSELVGSLPSAAGSAAPKENRLEVGIQRFPN